MAPLLEIERAHKRFFGLEVLRDVDLAVHPGEIVGLIGPNGSGKTTLFNCTTGQYTLDSGRVRYGGRDVTGWTPHRIALAGLARTFQMVQIYPRLTVTETLLVALQEHQGRNPLSRVLRLPSVRRAEAAARTRAARMLEEFGLGRLRADPAGTLSYGQRKLLEFAAVLMADPELVLSTSRLRRSTPP
jgi:branched-chain amino acid transport system ATP-binding protein